MLGNLKGCYLGRGDLRRALRSIEWSLLADSGHPEDLREQGIIRYRLGDLRGALLPIWNNFLEVQSSGAVADQTRTLLKQVQDLWVRRN